MNNLCVDVLESILLKTNRSLWKFCLVSKLFNRVVTYLVEKRGTKCYDEIMLDDMTIENKTLVKSIKYRHFEFFSRMCPRRYLAVLEWIEKNYNKHRQNKIFMEICHDLVIFDITDNKNRLILYEMESRSYDFSFEHIMLSLKSDNFDAFTFISGNKNVREKLFCNRFRGPLINSLIVMFGKNGSRPFFEFILIILSGGAHLTDVIDYGYSLYGFGFDIGGIRTLLRPKTEQYDIQTFIACCLDVGYEYDEHFALLVFND